MNLLELSQTIREIRRKQGMTVENLAAKSGFSKGFISQVENFRITPSLKALMRISSALGVPLESVIAPWHTARSDAKWTPSLSNTPPVRCGNI